jgi:predicted phage terminase large subunit-like protein
MSRDYLETIENPDVKKFTIDFPPLHEAQQTVKDDEARWKILCAGRRFGKSRLGVQLCLEQALDGGRVWWVAPTFAIARVGWRDVVAAASEFPKDAGVNIKLGDMEVTFPSGGSISVKSADNPQRLRGEGLNYLVMDEAAFVREETWTEVLRPTLTENKGSALFISTPIGMDNWFYHLWEKADTAEDWARFQYPTVSNPIIDPKEVESAREDLGELVFAQEYLAEFISEGAQIFRSSWFNYFKQGVGTIWADGKKYKESELQRFATVDLAVSTKESADYTVISVFGYHSEDDKLFMLDMFRDRVEAPDIVPQIERMVGIHNLEWVGIERAGYQLAIVQFARRQGIKIKELRADKDKRSRALPLSAKMERGLVYFPKDADWVSEVERELLTFPIGVHDDIVDTLAYATLAGNKKRKWQAY